MLIRKVTVCSSLFVLLLGGAWLLNKQNEVQRSKELAPSSLQSYKIYSTNHSSHQLQTFTPFLPREYMRIMHLDHIDIVPTQ